MYYFLPTITLEPGEDEVKISTTGADSLLTDKFWAETPLTGMIAKEDRAKAEQYIDRRETPSEAYLKMLMLK